MKPIGLIVVGLGARANVWLKVAQANPEIRIAALCDPDPAARARVKEKFPNIPISADIADIITTDADAILLCTPPGGREARLRQPALKDFPFLLKNHYRMM